MGRPQTARRVACPVCGKRKVVRGSRLRPEGNPCRGSCSREYPTGRDSYGYRGSANISGLLLCKWKRGATVRGIAWNITVAEVEALYVKQQGRCALTGRTLSFEKLHPDKISLDRIDSSKGYEAGNIQLTTALANRIKFTLDNGELTRFATAVIRQQSLPLAEYLAAF